MSEVCVTLSFFVLTFLLVLVCVPAEAFAHSVFALVLVC